MELWELLQVDNWDGISACHLRTAATIGQNRSCSDPTMPNRARVTAKYGYRHKRLS
jgi:hypothetical protein